ncbi:MAG: LURP-one-related/scramblase family protein [Lachnospiraceae bacterium]
MKLYIKQKIFSFTDKYDVYDEYGNVVFDVSSEFLSMVAKMHLSDTQGRELFYIKGRFKLFLSEYEIYKNNILCACIRQELSFFKPRLTVDSSYGNFDIQGDFMDMDFDIYHNGQLFGSLHKKWLSWGDSYELTIPSADNAAFFCALVIAIDNCLHNENNR